MAIPGFGSISCIIHMAAKIPPAAGALVGGGRMGGGRFGDTARAGRRQSAQAELELFGSLQATRSLWKIFAATWGVQIVVALVLVNLSVSATKQPPEASTKLHNATSLSPERPATASGPRPVVHTGVQSRQAATDRPTAKLAMPRGERKRLKAEVKGKTPELKIEGGIRRFAAQVARPVAFQRAS